MYGGSEIITYKTIKSGDMQRLKYRNRGYMKLRKNSKKKEDIIWKITKYDQERRYEYEEKNDWVF